MDFLKYAIIWAYFQIWSTELGIMQSNSIWKCLHCSIIVVGQLVFSSSFCFASSRGAAPPSCV